MVHPRLKKGFQLKGRASEQVSGLRRIPGTRLPKARAPWGWAGLPNNVKKSTLGVYRLERLLEEVDCAHAVPLIVLLTASRQKPCRLSAHMHGVLRLQASGAISALSVCPTTGQHGTCGPPGWAIGLSLARSLGESVPVRVMEGG